MQASLSCKGLGEWLLEEVGVIEVEQEDVAGLGDKASMSSTNCVCGHSCQLLPDNSLMLCEVDILKFIKKYFS